MRDAYEFFMCYYLFLDNPMEYYLPHFTDKETGPERSVNVPKVTQPESGRTWMQIQATWLHNMHFSLLCSPTPWDKLYYYPYFINEEMEKPELLYNLQEIILFVRNGVKIQIRY